MSHSSTIRRRTTRRRRCASADRVAAGAQAAAQRAAQVDVLAAAVALGAARAAQRRGELELASSAGRAARARPARARRSACSRSRSSSLAATGTRARRRRRLAVAAAPATPPPGAPPARPALAGPVVAARAASSPRRPRARVGERRAADSRRDRASTRAACARLATPRTAHASNALPGRVGDEHGARRPVQARARHRPVSVSASAKRAERSGVTGTPASCSRRPNAATSSGRVTPRRLSEAGGADDVLVLAVLEHADPSVRSIVVRVELGHAEQLERAQPVDRLGDAGRLLDVALAHLRHRGHDLHRQRLGRRPCTRRRTISSSRSLRTGSRSTGTGSGA